MEITRTSIISGITRTYNVAVTSKQIQNWLDGALIQDAMPSLTADEREFIKTGITGEEWNEIFGETPAKPPVLEKNVTVAMEPFECSACGRGMADDAELCHVCEELQP